MRIAMLSWESLHSIAVGGVAAHVTELAAALERKGHERPRLHPHWAAASAHYDRIHGVHYHRCPMHLLPDFVDEVNGMCTSFAHHFAGVEEPVGHVRRRPRPRLAGGQRDDLDQAGAGAGRAC